MKNNKVFGLALKQYTSFIHDKNKKKDENIHQSKAQQTWRSDKQTSTNKFKKLNKNSL